jgi:hypothetical protein
MPFYPDTLALDDSISVRHDGVGLAQLGVSLPSTSLEDAERTFTLLSCWWLRWIGQTDCAFWWEEDRWHACCRTAAPPDPIFKLILQDLLAIKNAVCTC